MPARPWAVSRAPTTDLDSMAMEVFGRTYRLSRTMGDRMEEGPACCAAPPIRTTAGAFG
ncbi:hypothetical protein FB563_4203 [Streptomyces puniciscabiei]|uniref:Uncharacterized protein n=1 Tax=Streptomyces puniciscabiei TaxID=164348 RepID=A0A542UJA1_9ACTN|nr:hypothetical protein FB563_4203 [Streptomyces puniciscabiei]